MLRRDISKALLATAAGSSLLVRQAKAQSCTPPCYPRTQAEIDANVVPSDPSYPPGNVKRYGAVGNGSNATVAIRSANAVALVAGSSVYFPAGTYKYQPDPQQGHGRLDIAHPWEGEGVESTRIVCNTSLYAGEYFRLIGSTEIRNLWFQNEGLTQQGTAIRICGPVETDFTGHVRLTRVWVQGFQSNIRADNSFLVALDQVRSEYGGYGFYCEPLGIVGQAAYVTTHLHLHCYYGFNTVNVFYNTATASTGVTFVGGANEGATAPFGANGSSYASYFGNIANLHFVDHYCEAQPAAIVISAHGRDVTFDGLYLNGTGGVYLGSNVRARFANVRTTTSTDLLAGGDATQHVLMEACRWPAAGNSTNFASLIAFQSDLNGTFHKALLPPP
jgi:hypothetical protein